MKACVFVDVKEFRPGQEPDSHPANKQQITSVNYTSTQPHQVRVEKARPMTLVYTYKTALYHTPQ